MREAGFTTFLVDDDPAVLKAITRLLNASGISIRA
jgi:FixJ family two-component response regulator